MGFEVSGVRNFAAQLRTDSGRVGARASQALRKTTLDVQGTARVNAPVDTGFLRESIEVAFMGDGRGSSMTSIVGVGANYGLFVELGTSKMGAQPYLFPAVDRHEPAFFAAMAQIRDTL